MPKEITHWLIAQKVGNSLQGTSAGDAAKAFPTCMLLGAILHDAPFYARVQRKHAQRKKVAVVATARKLLSVMRAMLLTGEVYNENLVLHQERLRQEAQAEQRRRFFG